MNIGWSDDDLLSRFECGWIGGLTSGTACGSGSVPRALGSVRAALFSVIGKYDIKRIREAGAGDGQWHGGLLTSLDYIGYDLVPRAKEIIKRDFTVTALPTCDLIICRMALIHLDPPRIIQALDLFRRSAPYLLATTYDGDHEFDPAKQFNRMNLEQLLGPCLEKIPEDIERGCFLGLWRM